MSKIENLTILLAGDMIEKKISQPEVKKHIIAYVLPRFVDRLANIDKNQKSVQVGDCVLLIRDVKRNETITL